MLQKNNDATGGLARFLKALNKQLLGMAPGDFLIVPAGWQIP